MNQIEQTKETLLRMMEKGTHPHGQSFEAVDILRLAKAYGIICAASEPESPQAALARAMAKRMETDTSFEMPEEFDQ